MPPMIAIGETALIDAGRIIAVVPRRSAPVIRMLKTFPRERILNLTYGYPRHSVIVFDDGTIAFISLTVETLRDVLRRYMVVVDVEPDEA